ncbi:MAG: hypothetical protein IPG40_00145 [Zoogloea sp.]|nr:hypothetical protein [Zoogloea sp.]
MPRGNSVFRRKSFVGLAGSMGTVVFGRIDGGRYCVAGKYDPSPTARCPT